jgi:hypothetical protein
LAFVLIKEGDSCEKLQILKLVIWGWVRGVVACEPLAPVYFSRFTSGADYFFPGLLQSIEVQILFIVVFQTSSLFFFL